MNNEEKITEKKSNKWILIVIILLIVIGIGCFSYYEFYLKSDDTKVSDEDKDDESTNEEVTSMELDVLDDRVQIALGFVNVISIDEETAYTDGVFNVSSLTKEQLIATAFNGISILSACDESGEKTELTIDDLNKAIQEVLVTDANLTIDDLTDSEYAESSYTGMTYEIGGYGYSVDGDTITVVGSCGSEGVPDTQTMTKTISASLNGNHLIIKQKVGFGILNDEYNDDVAYKFYNDSKRSLGFVENKVYDEIEDLTWEEYNTYQFTFVIEDDDYKLESISLVEE